MSDLTRHEGKGGKSRRRMASERQIKTPWTACRQNDLTADQPLKPTRTPVQHPYQQAMAMTNLSRITTTRFSNSVATLKWTVEDICGMSRNEMNALG